PGVEFAGRKLHDEPLYRVPVLPDHDDPLIVQKGDHHHRAGVAYVLAYALPSIGQAHRITPDLQKAAFVDRFTLEGGFGDVRYVTAHAQRSYSRGRVGITLVYGLDALQHILRQLDIDTVDVFLELIEVGGADEVAGDKGLLVHEGLRQDGRRQTVIERQLHIFRCGFL